MGAVTLRTNGQNVTLTAVYDMDRETPASAYSDAGLSSALSLPYTVTDGGLIYLVTGNKRVTLVVAGGGTYAEHVIVQRDQQIVDIPLESVGSAAVVANAIPATGYTGGADLSGATSFKLPAASNTVTVFNVKMYGAVGNSTADDTVAIQAAVTAAAAVSGANNGGGVVYFPPGTYKITDVITLPSSKITIQGSGIKSTWINQTGANKHGFAASNCREFTFRDFSLNGTTTGTGDGIYLAATGTYAVFDCRFENLYIQQFGRHGIHTEDLCTSVFNHVRVDTSGGDGFHLGDNGTSGLGGTSVTMMSCFANACTGNNYYLDLLKYCALAGCASDSAGGAGYQINRSSGISMTACGVEDSTGHGFYITDGSTSIHLAACWATRVSAASIGFHVSQNSGSSCSRIVVTACRVLGGVTPLASAKVDTACQAEFIGFQPHPSAGFTGTGVMTFRAHDNTGLTSFGQAPVAGDEPLVSWVASSSTYAYGASVVADSVRRWAVRGDGRLEWGTGALTRDTNLYRHTSGLRTDNTLIANNVNVGSPSGEAKLYMTYADSQSTSIGLSMYETAGTQTSLEMQYMEATSASKRLFGAKVTGDSSRRIVILASGQILWGSGSALDTNLYRAAADVLATDDDLSLKTVGKGLSVKEGSNAKQGTATLSGGTVVVSNTSVTATSRIFLTVQSLGTVSVPKAVGVTARTAGTSFTITSADGTDTSVVAYEIFEPSA